MADYKYVSGFFDADGSVSLKRWRHNSRWRGPVVCFSSIHEAVLKKIQSIVGEKGFLSRQVPASKKRHTSARYKLEYFYSNAVKLAGKLLRHSLHPIKRKQLRMIAERYPELTVQNGRYTLAGASRKMKFEEDFLNIRVTAAKRKAAAT